MEILAAAFQRDLLPAGPRTKEELAKWGKQHFEALLVSKPHLLRQLEPLLARGLQLYSDYSGNDGQREDLYRHIDYILLMRPEWGLDVNLRLQHNRRATRARRARTTAEVSQTDCWQYPVTCRKNLCPKLHGWESTATRAMAPRGKIEVLLRSRSFRIAVILSFIMPVAEAGWQNSADAEVTVYLSTRSVFTALLLCMIVQIGVSGCLRRARPLQRRTVSVATQTIPVTFANIADKSVQTLHYRQIRRYWEWSAVDLREELIRRQIVPGHLKTLCIQQLLEDDQRTVAWSGTPVQRNG